MDMASKLTRAVVPPAGEDHVRIVDDTTSAVLLDVRPMQRVWVRLGAQASRSHGPTLRMQVLASGHPAAVRATAAAAAAQSRPHYQPNSVCGLAAIATVATGFPILV